MVTLLGGVLVLAALTAFCWGVARLLEPLDPVAEKSWWGVFALPLLGAAVLVPTESAAPVPTEVAKVDFTAPSVPDAVRERPKNVLFLTIDTLRADHLGAWGYSRATSPVLDALASDGTRIEQMTAASSGTVPSFGTMHTGLLPECTGVVHQLGSVGPGAVTLAERMGEAGYSTFAVVTNHNLDEKHGFTQGYDQFENLGEAKGDAVVDRAMELWPTEGPVFAWVHLFDPHTPYWPPEPLIADFRGDEMWDDTLLPIVDFGSWGGVHRTRTTGTPLPGGTVSRGELVARYDAEIAFADEQVGRLLEWMDRSGRLEDTVIVFSSDHGETLTRGPRDVVFQHALQNYADDLYIPTFLWGPGRIPQAEIDVPTRHIDLVPTILDAVRLPRDSSLPGTSVLRDGKRSTVAIARNAWWDAVSMRLVPLAKQGATRSVEHDGWKLVTYPDTALSRLNGPLAWVDAWRNLWSGITQDDQLFHIAEDPAELDNRIATEPERARELRALLAGELERGMPERCRDTHGTDIELDAETRERLKRMGYLD